MIAAAARNLATWHDVSLHAAGVATEVRAGVWTAEPGGAGIFYDAITLDPDADPVVPGATTVCDSFDVAGDLGTALRRDGHAPWYLRPAGTTPSALVPAGVTIDRLVEGDAAALADVERCAARAFDVWLPDRPGAVHPPEVLADRRLRVLVARHDARVVGTAMSLDDGVVVGIYGVAVDDDARRRGIASALTATLLAASPGRPAVLTPTPQAARLYRRAGFVEIGRFGVLRAGRGPAPAADR